MHRCWISLPVALAIVRSSPSFRLLMDSNSTRKERSRAFERFNAILNVHSAILEAFQLVAAIPDATALVGASIHLRHRMTPKLSADELDSAATSVLNVVNEERDRKYEIVRSSTLIAVCGAFEYLAKAAFVDKAAMNPAEAATLLGNAKIRLAAAEVLGTPSSEQWFTIADRLFEQLAERYPRMHERLRHYLLDYAYVPHKVERNYLTKALGAADVGAFNEAFLVRNCMVHKGGRVSSQLARMTGQPAGAEIPLDKEYLTRLLGPIRELAPILGSPLLMEI